MFFCSNTLKILVEKICQDPSLMQEGEDFIKAVIYVPHGSIKIYLQHALMERGISCLRVTIEIFDGVLAMKNSFWELFVARFFQEMGDRFEKIKNPFLAARQWKMALFSAYVLGEKHDVEGEFGAIYRVFYPWCCQKNPFAYEPFAQDAYVKNAAAVFFFGFSSMSPLLIRYCTSIRAKFFFLSPCMLYWGDILPQGSVGHFSKEENGVELLLDHRHHLLANGGALGRDFLNLLIDHNCSINGLYELHPAVYRAPYEQYCIGEMISVEGGKNSSTLLDYIRADLLTLFAGDGEKRILPFDESVQIHAAYTCLHEVYALRQMIEKKAKLRPGGVLVVCADIARYESAFAQVFPEKGMYQILGLHKKGGIIETFFAMIRLFQGSCRGDDLASILSIECVRNAFDLDEYGSSELKEFLTSKPMKWGTSEEYQYRYNESRCLPQAEVGPCLLKSAQDFLNLFFEPTEKTLKTHLCMGGLSLFLFLETVDSLLPLPLCDEKEYDVEAIFSFFEFLLTTFSDDELMDEAAALATILQTTASLLRGIGMRKIVFSSLMRTLERLLKKEGVYQGALYSPILVASFGDFEPFPADCIALLGADEDVVPKNDDEALLDHIHLMVKKSSFSNIEYQKYQFIQILLSAKTLFISYKKYCFETREEKEPSALVKMLLAHCNTQYQFSEEPFIALGENVPSKVVKESIEEKVMYTQKMDQWHSFPRKNTKQDWKGISSAPPISRDGILDIGTLLWQIRFPHRIFFEATYGFAASGAVAGSLFMPFRKQQKFFWDEMNGKIVFPYKDYVDAGSQIKKCFSSIGYTAVTQIEVHCIPQRDQGVHQTNFSYRTDCIRIGQHVISGTFSRQCAEGVLLFSEQIEAELFDLWPEVALRAYLAKTKNIPFCSNFILIQEESVIPAKGLENIFEAYMMLYEEAKTVFFPFQYDIVKMLLSKVPEEKIIETFLDQYMQKSFGHELNMDMIERFLPLWKERAATIFSPLFSIKETEDV